MKVLSIDPGYGRCGVAVLEGDARGAKIIFSTCIETSAKATLAERLTSVVTTIEHLLETHKPDFYVIEELFFSNNTKTAMKVAEVRGALLYIATRANVPIIELHPGATKIALTGYGRATKDQMEFMVKKLIDLPEGKRIDDEFDAIALGLTALAESSYRTNMLRNKAI
jgi:crossover junction endodeoxyribonuclease RuvC